MSIPKKIHYCWFGGNPKGELVEKCMASWKKYCSDYEIIEWNENNFDVNCNEYCHHMYTSKKWAFLTDYVRLKVVHDNGGIYLDTDVELLKSLDSLLKYDAFMASEDGVFVNTGLGFGAVSGQSIITENMQYYEKISGFEELKKCPEITTGILNAHGYTDAHKICEISDVTIFPRDFFSPKDYYTEKIHITDNSVAIHHFAGSWKAPETLKQRLCRRYRSFDYFIHIPNRIGMLLLGDRYNDLKRMLKK